MSNKLEACNYHSYLHAVCISNQHTGKKRNGVLKKKKDELLDSSNTQRQLQVRTIVTAVTLHSENHPVCLNTYRGE